MAGRKALAKTPHFILKRWDTMNYWMGEGIFDSLQAALWAEGLRNFTGEPDLFCWEPESRKWFFAEAKGKDRLTQSERLWFDVCTQMLGPLADIRVYRVTPDRY